MLGYRDGQMVAKWNKASGAPLPAAADVIVRGTYLDAIGQAPMASDTVERFHRIDGIPPCFDP